MRIIAIAFCVCAAVTFANAQSVQLFNITHPNTWLEVGDQAQIVITGAAVSSPITFSLNGSYYSAGNTDASGNRTITTYAYTSSDVNSWTENWYVNDTLIMPNNADTDWLVWAPTLPDFNVELRDDSPYCASERSFTSSCNSSYILNHWPYSPLTIHNSSSLIDGGDVSTAISSWNDLGINIELSSDHTHRNDIYVEDNNTLDDDTYGLTTFEGADCAPDCFDYTIYCSGSASGACQNGSSFFQATISLHASAITTLAGSDYLNVSPAYVGTLVLEHELGHVLGLDDLVFGDGICSSIDDIMGHGPDLVIGCGVTAPQYCDLTAVNTVYPSAVGSCSTSTAVYCTSTPCY